MEIRRGPSSSPRETSWVPSGGGGRTGPCRRSGLPFPHRTHRSITSYLRTSDLPRRRFVRGSYCPYTGRFERRAGPTESVTNKIRVLPVLPPPRVSRSTLLQTSGPQVDTERHSGPRPTSWRDTVKVGRIRRDRSPSRPPFPRLREEKPPRAPSYLSTSPPHTSSGSLSTDTTTLLLPRISSRTHTRSTTLAPSRALLCETRVLERVSSSSNL